MIDLDEIKMPSYDDVHKIVRLNEIPPLLGRDRISRGSNIVENNFWFDKFGIRYTFKNGKLFISNAKELETLLKHIDQIKSNIEVVIDVKECAFFNCLCRALHDNPTNKKIVIAIPCSCHFNKRQRLDFELLPGNVKVSNLYCDYREQLPLNNDFDWWGLWLNDRDFACVREKLTQLARERFEKMHFIAQSFYVSFSNSYGSSMSDKDKTDFVFRWLLKNIRYDDKAVNPDGTLKREKIGYIAQDIVCTFERRRGVCAGRAGLMKMLLNNRFMRVNCFLISGMHGKLNHMWNQIYFDDGIKEYYDLSYGVCNRKTLSYPYHKLDHSDAERGYIADTVSFPPRRGDTDSVMIPPLPLRNNDSDLIGVQKRKLPRENTPSPLPRRENLEN